MSVAQPNDAAAIARFKRRLSTAHRRVLRVGNAQSGAPDKGREVMPNSIPISVIARDRDSGIVVGHAVAVPTSDGAADLNVVVAEAYEHHQIGTLLVEQVLQEARQRGVRAFHADAFAANRRVLDIFARKGFSLLAENDGAAKISASRDARRESSPVQLTRK